MLPFMSKRNGLVVSVTSDSQRKPMKPNKRDFDWREATREHDRQRISWHIVGSACRKASALINSSCSAHLRNEVEQATGQSQRIWKAVRRLLHLGPGAVWYEGLVTDALATGLCDFFVDKVKQVKVKVEHSLHGTPSDNQLTEPTLIKPQHNLKLFACVTASEVK